MISSSSFFSIPGFRAPSQGSSPAVMLLMAALAATLLALSLPTATAQAGPFGPGTGGRHATTSSEPDQAENPDQEVRQSRSPFATKRESATPGILGRVLQQSAAIQKEIKSAMAGYARAIQRQPGGSAFWAFLGLAALYGVFHALGPGHGKTVISAYCLSRPTTPARALLMGSALSTVHVGSATLLVAVAYLILAKNMAGFQAAGIWLERASYALLLCLGLGLSLAALRRLKRPAASPSTPEEQPASLRSMLGTAFITGLVPCPGATLILVFALSLRIPATGFISMLFLALGMGLTTGLFGLAAAGARSAALRSTRSSPRGARLLHGLLSLGGALCITLFGAILLLGSLPPS
ncbi:MAG: nickel/cobalt transporter [Desulfovibrio sp.]